VPTKQEKRDNGRVALEFGSLARAKAQRAHKAQQEPAELERERNELRAGAW
jgi:hypothetical protein